MSITNRIENIIIAVVVSAITIGITLFVINMTMVPAYENRIAGLEAKNDKQTAVIVELAKIEKFKIENNFDKLKAKDGQIVLSLDNKLTTLQLDSIREPAPVPGEVTQAKKSFWNKVKFW